MRRKILGYSVIQSLRVAPPVSSPTGSVGGVGCRLYACNEPDACMRGVQSGTLEDICPKKYCMRVWARLNAYMLTLCPIYEIIASGGVQPRRTRCALHAEYGHINNRIHSN